ncbi:hypothetical protein KQ874_02265 [Mycoplasma sp. ES3157-GEN-MYC]|uniref:Uncharacterized protein n=1 Tax=Mycoplasma miroungigenitalium TaxID=754515 RepID=A0A6M4J9H9_9MOLU|nr:hypothetical protein [Mycoplasma miroungigenitalium]MBU4690509.1 hypothetical protein [Mycoplasma miroungigenitalium]MBU4691776.1 hypothetical protein [Mycoplasma miroungigenitalium]QJR43603.1 hypothetical protein HLA87_02270 [Mycoplasma miroungigenitalium]
MNKKKVWIPIICVATAASVITPIFVLSAKKSHSVTEEEKSLTLNKTEVFPDLDKSIVYQYIRYDKDNVKFDLSVIPAVFKNVMSNIQVNPDRANFDYEIITDSLIKLYFKVYSGNDIYTNCYTLNAHM